MQLALLKRKNIGTFFVQC